MLLLMNQSDRFALVATLSTCVFQLRLLEISTPIPGTADHLEDLTVQYVLCVKRGLGCSHTDDLALGGVKLHIPLAFPSLQSVQVPL